MYDKDKSKTIQLGEMVELFGTLYLNEGLEKEAAVERAMAIFSTLDINNDGDVTEEEFVRGCLEVAIIFSGHYALFSFDIVGNLVSGCKFWKNLHIKFFSKS